MRDARANVDDVVVELDHLLEASADRCQRRFDVLKRDFHLFASVGAHSASLVDAELASEIHCAAWSGYLYYMAVARRLPWRLLHRIGIRETDVIRHVWLLSVNCAAAGEIAPATANVTVPVIRPLRETSAENCGKESDEGASAMWDLLMLGTYSIAQGSSRSRPSSPMRRPLHSPALTAIKASCSLWAIPLPPAVIGAEANY